MVFDFSLADCAALPSAAGCMNAFHILGLGVGLGLDRFGVRFGVGLGLG